MFMGWTEKDREELVRGLRFLLGLPALIVMLIASLDNISGKINTPWDATAFLLGLGFAIILKSIEYFIRRQQKFLNKKG